MELKFNKYLVVEDVPIKDAKGYETVEISRKRDLEESKLEQVANVASLKREDSIKSKSSNEVNGDKFELPHDGNRYKRSESFKNVKEKQSMTHEDMMLTLPTILKMFKKKLESYIDNQKNTTLNKSDFERTGGNSEMQDPFEKVQDDMNNNDPYDEGRKSFIRIKNKKNWPPTMEDLLEYISIYSQMNNIKFTTLNYDVYFEKQNNSKRVNKKKTKQMSVKSSSHHKKGNSVSKNKEANGIKNSPRSDIMEAARSMSMAKNVQKTGGGNETLAEDPEIKLLEDLADTVIIIEEKYEEGKEKQNKGNDPEYRFRLNYSKMYEVLFESSIKDDAGIKFLDSDNSKQLEVIKNILKVMHDRIRSRNEDVIQTIDVLEYYVKILIDIPNISVLKYALTLMNELLKGDFIIKGERPFKSFY